MRRVRRKGEGREKEGRRLGGMGTYSPVAQPAQPLKSARSTSSIGIFFFVHTSLHIHAILTIKDTQVIPLED